MKKDHSWGGGIIWNPTPQYVERSHLKRFMSLHHIESFAKLHARSIEDIAWFTDSVIRYLDIQFQSPYRQVLSLNRGIEFPDWCVGGKLNIVENCVDKWIAKPDSRNRPAIIWEGEEGQISQLTYGELFKVVNQCANALRELELRKGDFIGLYMPMTLEACIALLACAKIGAVCLPLFSGYGAGALVSRLGHAKIKALFTADGFYRRGRVTPMKSVADQAAEELPTLKHLIVLKRTGIDVDWRQGRDHWWHELIPSQRENTLPAQTDAEDMLMLLYTSGTTGRPKGAVHTHCSFPIKAAQDMAFGTDVQPGDVIHWYSDMGWMMGPWLVFGATILGATCFIYDGALDYPGPDRLWSLVERHKISVLGISPTLIRSLIPHGVEPVRAHNLSSIHLFASTGEPWNHDPWLWLFETVGKGQRPIINYSGGTEVGGGILMGNPLLPLKPTAFSAPCPGIAADVVDSQGMPVRGEVGELVVRTPWIGMTRGFWQDEQRYLETYWSQIKDVWVHGDLAAVDSDGMWYILGRSDDTLKIAGRRVGPAEVESVLVDHSAVSEAAAIGVPHLVKGSEIVCFCVLAPGFRASDNLSLELREKVARELGKPMQPSRVHFVPDLPKTRNSKVMRRMIRSAYVGEEEGDTSSLVNPEAIEPIRQLKQKDGNFLQD